MSDFAMEVVRVGGDHRLYQISHGQNYGLLEIEPQHAAPALDRRRTLEEPDVRAVLVEWLNADGVLLGSPQPPRLRWDDLRRRVPRLG
jgi:hypothetical protein